VHLTALVEGSDHVCCRYRVAAFRPYLERAGHQLEIVELPKQWWRRIQMFRSLERADAVVLQRKLMQRWQIYMLRRAARMLVYDLDDAVFLRNSYSPKGLLSRARASRFKAMIGASDATVVGNAFLREKVWLQRPDSRAHLIPTCIAPHLYPLAHHAERGFSAQLVWIGSSSTLRGLDVSRPLLEEMGRRCGGLKLKLICDGFLEFDHLSIVRCRWSETTEARELAASDIGISWVPDDQWSRGKCGLKILQYMAAGLPVVANPVGVQAEMVKHGVTGFLAETPAQWSEAITKLTHDPDLRRRMGRAGRERVERDFSVEAGAARWLLLLDELQQRRRVA
jgi:glycosyltransferase involved in cell wall biosynthesis